MTVWEMVQELAQCDPNMQVKANVVGERVECFNHRIDDDDVVDFDKDSYTVNVIQRNGAVFVEVIEKKEVQIVEQAKEIEPVAFFYLSDEERYITECVVIGEAGAESYEGQVLVAQCILNGCLKEDVQPSELRKLYKYAGFKKNSTESVKKAVSAVFDDGFKITDEPILYFYAPKICKSKWHESQCFVLELENQRFFKEKER